MTAELDPRIIRRMADMNAVYRMYSHTGELLYIGMTGRLRRFDDHAMKRWFPLVSRITLEWHPTEAAARLNERRAIQAERPRYNIAATPKARRPKAAVLPAPAFRPALAPARDVLLDALRVFGTNPGLHWGVLAERLAEQIPSRWADATKETISAQMRAAGVRSVTVRMNGESRPVLQGCRRDAVEKAQLDRMSVAR